METGKTLLTLILVANCASVPARAVDFDEDGIDDTLEQTLIDQYRPFLRYDGNERFWPSSVTWFVQHSDLWYAPGNGSLMSPIYYSETLAPDPLRILHPQESSFWPIFRNPEGSSTADGFIGNVGYHLSSAVNWRGGQGPTPVGTYGHVVPVGGPVKYAGRDPLPVGPGDFLVQDLAVLSL